MNHLIDILLFPIYAAFFIVLFAWRRKRIENPLLKKYHKILFIVKFISTLGYIIFSLFIIGNDSTYLYYPEGVNIFKLILKDFSNIDLFFAKGDDFDYSLLANTLNKGYFRSQSNYLVTLTVSFLSFFTFTSYSVITLFFSMFAFSGAWRLYKFFYEQYPHLHKQIALAVLFLPDFVFWSSGILKDSICIGCLGWLTYAFYEMALKKKSIIKNTIIIALSATLLGAVKAYILFSYLPFFLIYLVFSTLNKIGSTVLKLIMVFVVIIMAIAGTVLLGDRLQKEMGNLALEKIGESVQKAQQGFDRIADMASSTFSLGIDYDASTPTGLLKAAPAGIVATLFRPFLWESKKATTVVSSLESMLLMFLTLYALFKAGPISFFGGIIKNPMIFFCIMFSLLFAVFVGITTFNFGTLVRYKIPCLPFYVMGMVLIIDRKRKIIAKSNDAKDKVALENNNKV